MSELRPLFDRLVVKEIEEDTVRKSGLLLPSIGERSRTPPQEGIVLAVGPGLDWWAQAGVPMPVKAGDHIMFPASAGAYIDLDEERLLVLRVGDLLGVVE